MFPTGPPIQYWPGPVTVNFGVRKRSGVFVTVWPLANKELRNVPTRSCYSKDLQKKVTFFKVSKCVLFWHTATLLRAKYYRSECSLTNIRQQNHFSTNKLEQIIGTQDKPQCLVAQRLLSHLQYLDATKSSAKDLSPAQFNLWLLEDSLAKIPAAEIRLGLFLFT